MCVCVLGEPVFQLARANANARDQGKLYLYFRALKSQ
jgi:hypothetical protein